MMQPPTGITHHRFSLFRFRSPLLTESLLFSLPAGTEMFHFPAFPPTGLYIQPAVTHHNNEQGFPIRTSSDQRPVIGSPRLIADSHVLHRLLVPRHPPCALTTYKQSKKKSQKTHHTPTHKTRRCTAQLPEDARVHYTVLKQQTTPPPEPEKTPSTSTSQSHRPHSVQPENPTAHLNGPTTNQET